MEAFQCNYVDGKNYSDAQKVVPYSGGQSIFADENVHNLILLPWFSPSI